jgi:germination protein YpeB
MYRDIARKRIIYSVVVTVMACLLYLDRIQLGNSLQGKYQKQLFSLIDNVQVLEADLSKVGVTASPRQSTLLFGDIWRQAGAAADNVNSLPINHSSISQTSRFLAQVSDFSFSLLKLQNDGDKLTDAEWKNLEELKKNAAYLRQQLYGLQKEMNDGNIRWVEIKNEGGKLLGQAKASLVEEKFVSIDKQMQNHPTLIYDGPFSENILEIKPKVLSEPQITIEQAKQKVYEIIGKEKVEDIGVYSPKGNGKIPIYAFSVSIKGRDKKDQINIDISKNGGHVVYMIDNRALGNTKFDTKKAIDKGLDFLNNRGYKDMIPSFCQKNGNSIVVNYIYTQKVEKTETVIYPDQIKLKIALDNGDIIGIEAEKYLVAHSIRKLPKPSISVDKARQNASSKLKITNTRLALIPMNSTREVFCYEFVGKRDKDTFIIYINAENGREENILQIIDTSDGQLAM